MNLYFYRTLFHFPHTLNFFSTFFLIPLSLPSHPLPSSPYSLSNLCSYTVKRVDEVVPHRHLVTQDQTTQVSNKFFHIHVKLIVCKCWTSSTMQESVKSSMRGAGANLRPTGLQSATLPLRHAFNSNQGMRRRSLSQWVLHCHCRTFSTVKI